MFRSWKKQSKPTDDEGAAEHGKGYKSPFKSILRANFNFKGALGRTPIPISKSEANDQIIADTLTPAASSSGSGMQLPQESSSSAKVPRSSTHDPGSGVNRTLVYPGLPGSEADGTSAADSKQKENGGEKVSGIGGGERVLERRGGERVSPGMAFPVTLGRKRVQARPDMSPLHGDVSSPISGDVIKGAKSPGSAASGSQSATYNLEDEGIDDRTSVLRSTSSTSSTGSTATCTRGDTVGQPAVHGLDMKLSGDKDTPQAPLMEVPGESTVAAAAVDSGDANASVDSAADAADDALNTGAGATTAASAATTAASAAGTFALPSSVSSGSRNCVSLQRLPLDSATQGAKEAGKLVFHQPCATPPKGSFQMRGVSTIWVTIFTFVAIATFPWLLAILPIAIVLAAPITMGSFLVVASIAFVHALIIAARAHAKAPY